MYNVELGCIADDLTGATDLANELAQGGLEAVVLVGEHLSDLVIPAGAQAVVVALKSRSIAAELAVAQSLEALAALRSAGAKRIYFKYCSTFDSTAEGNIGPVLDALAEALGATGAIACPAFPATGRTVYNGHLFVGTQLLSDSPLRHHPLNPMTDSNLVRVLQAQMRGKVGLVTRRDVAGGALDAAIATQQADGAVAVIADAIDDDDLSALGRHCAGAPLSSGGSGLGAGIARAIAGEGAPRASAALTAAGGRRAIVAGSCSQATRRQLAHAVQHYPSLRVVLDAGRTEAQALEEIRTWVGAQDPAATVVIYSTAAPDEVERQRQAWGGEVSAAFERILGAASAWLVESGVRELIVAGGETSGAAIAALGCSTLAIGPEIDPGVPWTIAGTADGETLLLALKSGNFGGDDFMVRAWEQLG